MSTIFEIRENEKETKVRYMVVNAPSPFNIIFGRLVFNALEVALSSLYMTRKFPLEGRKLGIIKGSQEHTRQCYRDNLLLRKVEKEKPTPKLYEVQFIDLDPHNDSLEKSLTLIEDLKKIQIS